MSDDPEFGSTAWIDEFAGVWREALKAAQTPGRCGCLVTIDTGPDPVNEAEQNPLCWKHPDMGMVHDVLGALLDDRDRLRALVEGGGDE